MKYFYSMRLLYSFKHFKRNAIFPANEVIVGQVF